MKWIDASEVVCGFVYMGKLPADMVNPQTVWPDYAFIVRMKQEGASDIEITAKDFSAVQACKKAAESANGTLDAPKKYITLMEKACQNAAAEIEVDKFKKKLANGEAVEAFELHAIASKLEGSSLAKFIAMYDVAPQKVKFIPTGWKPLDKHTGGVPYACVTIIASNPGVGKTTLGLKIVSCMIKRKENKKKKAAVLTLEMTMGQVHQRYIEIEDLSDDEKKRILLGRIFNIHEISAAVTQLAAQEDLCCVMIDFADLIVEGEQTESAMGVVYKELELLATKIEVPIILIAQLNRQTYESGMPRIHHIRYSGLAEATARLILLLYNPNSVFVDFTKKEDSPLTIVPGRGYIIVGKSNFGYKEGGPGAIQVDWDGEAGWGDESYMYVKLASV